MIWRATLDDPPGPLTVMPYRTAIDKTAADHKRFMAVLVTFYRKRLRQVIR